MPHAGCQGRTSGLRVAIGLWVVVFFFFFFFNGILISVALQHGAICSWQLSKCF